MLEEFERLGLGVIRAGRRGRPTRLEWTSDAKAVGRAARGEAFILPAAEHEPETVPTVEARLPLRDDFELSIEIPKDLTIAEAERISLFIRALAR